MRLISGKTVEEKKIEIVLILDQLKKLIKEYKGIHSDILVFAPAYLHLFSKLIDDPDLRPHERYLVNSVVSYAITIENVIPMKSFGAYGFIDDLYLLTYTIHLLDQGKQSKASVLRHWDQQENVFLLASKIIWEVENSPDEKIRNSIPQILKFIDFDTERDKEQEPVDIKDSFEDTGKKKILDIDTTLSEVNQICESLREDAQDDSLRNAAPTKELTVNPNLLQEKIPINTILHLTAKAKYTNILTAGERHALFDIARKKCKGWSLSQKQINYLEDLIRRAIDQGIGTMECEEAPCEQCDELKDILRRLGYTEEK
jgi:uncharacterized membrane protein YkvA (DUF1232 family)